MEKIMPSKVLQIGAEAVIFQENRNIIKRRLKKSYRIPEIDEKIRKLRTRSEGKLLEKASKIIDIPKIIKIDENKKEIFLEFINGKKLSENIDKFSLKKQKEICFVIGKSIAKLHDSNIIHGDLTTSNMIFVENSRKKDNKIYSRREVMEGIGGGTLTASVFGEWGSRFRGGRELQRRCLESGGVDFGVGGEENTNLKIFFIDFGLGFISHKIEDKAVDLHLLKQTLEAKHFKNWRSLFESVTKGYKNYGESKRILEQLKKVEQRGRYKDKY